jgi:beta-lactam-binding protein with PASTA domain
MSRLTAALRYVLLTIAVVLATEAGLSLEAQQPATYMAAQVPTVPTPDFTGMTMEQVQARETIPAKYKGAPTQLFRSISTAGPTDGVVVSQTPAVGVPVYPGRAELSLTFQPPKASALGKKIAGMFRKRPEATVPTLTGYTCEVATSLLARQRLQAVCGGDTSGVVAQQYPAAGTAVAINTVVNVTLQAPLVVVPTVTGLTLVPAAETLAAKRLHIGVVTGEIKDQEPLPIISQSPVAGTSVPVNTAVDVTLQTPAAPPPPPIIIVVPYLERLSRADATKILASVGLTEGTVTGPAAGIVTSQSPATGTQVVQGSAVDLTLDVPRIPVPDMVGQSLAVAERQVGSLRLTDEARYPEGNGDRKTMLVESQDPAPGAMVPVGTRVVLQMAGGSLPVPRKWIGLGVAGVLGLGLGTWAIRRLLTPHAVITTYAHANPAKTKITCAKSPGIKFTITLRDEPVGATYRADHEPEVLQKGGKR